MTLKEILEAIWMYHPLKDANEPAQWSMLDVIDDLDEDDYFKHCEDKK